MPIDSRTATDFRIQVVGAAIVRGDTCLVAQRSAGSGSEAHRWEFPGGKVEPGELPREALRREIREELCLEIEVDQRLGRSEHSENGCTIVLDVYTAHLVAGEIRLMEHQSCGWFEAGEIDALDWAAADRPMLPSLKNFLAGTLPGRR